MDISGDEREATKETVSWGKESGSYNNASGGT